MPDDGRGTAVVEIIPIRRSGRVAQCLLRRAGGSLRIPWPRDGAAHEAVTAFATGAGLDPLLGHSTSWRQDGPDLVVTYLVVVEGHAPPACAFRPVRPGPLPRGGALSAPGDVHELDVARHGMAHLAWLHRTDPAVRCALHDWGEVLSAFDPQPFRALTPDTTQAAHGGRACRPEPLLLRPEEAARALAVSRSKLYELLAAGEVESVRIGSSRRVPVEAVERFVLALQGGPTAAAQAAARTHALPGVPSASPRRPQRTTRRSA